MPKQEVYTCDCCKKSVPINHADAADYMILQGSRVRRTWKTVEEQGKINFHRIHCPRCQETLEQLLEALTKNMEESG